VIYYASLPVAFIMYLVVTNRINGALGAVLKVLVVIALACSVPA